MIAPKGRRLFLDYVQTSVPQSQGKKHHFFIVLKLRSQPEL